MNVPFPSLPFSLPLPLPPSSFSWRVRDGGGYDKSREGSVRRGFGKREHSLGKSRENFYKLRRYMGKGVGVG